MTNIANDTKKLIDYSVGFAEKLLNGCEEFYPFASTINLSGDLIPTSYFAGEDHPLSEDLMIDLNAMLERRLENKEKRAYAMTYDVKVKKGTNGKTDAIAVKIKHTETKEITVYYFAYRMNSKKIVEHLDSWGEILTENELS